MDERLTEIVWSMRFWTLCSERTSTWIGVASPPAETISWLTVVMVESEDLGFGGNDAVGLDGSLMDLAATTTSI